jgi:NhaA family Na+:H+ antiporter
MRIVNSLRDFLALEASAGILLALSAAAALVLANSPLAFLYSTFLDTPGEVRVAGFQIAKPMLLWVNDGLMAIFFFLVGLEIKREVLEGELSDRRQIVLPAVAAVCGIAVPALIYAAINLGDPVALRGWAIPAATDIAFALGVLSLLGNRVPASIKVFLLTVAILDDLGAIVIIAIFYSDSLAPVSFGVAAIALLVLAALNRSGVVRVAPYLFVGLILWASVLKSGVHATLAGVALAFFIPLRAGGDGGHSPLRRLEQDLHPLVAFAILPLFAFANAGVSLQGVTLAALLQPIPLGIAMGLLVGKTAGVFLASWATVKLGLARLPRGASWRSMLGVSVLCGIGFTMSLFIGGLAFDGASSEHVVQTRLGILCGSLAAALLGYLVLRTTHASPMPEGMHRVAPPGQ